MKEKAATCCHEVTDIQRSVENAVEALLLEVKKVHPILISSTVSGTMKEQKLESQMILTILFSLTISLNQPISNLMSCLTLL